VRVDAGVAEGQNITVHYDPMIAKVITSGETREAAWARASLALRNFEILGLRHNSPFLLALLTHPDVLACRTHTRFIEEHLDELTTASSEDNTHAQVALAALLGISSSTAAVRQTSSAIDPWSTIGKVDW
jgi:acetyl/propionyl-CoA carboxylase alpha subunit